MSRLCSALLAAAAATLLVGCGATMPAPEERPPPEPPATIEDAEQRVDEAERELQGLLAPAPEEPDAASADRAEPMQPGALTERATQEKTTGGAPQSPQGRCTIACRALGSMHRSVDRLCALAGDDDARCEDVRQRLGAARRLVRRACPACVE